MYSRAISAVTIASLFASASAETILGVFLFHRHGDRTPKSLKPTNLTDLGYREVYASGSYYHDRYVSSSSPQHLYGLSSDIVNNEQIAVSAPADSVLQNSATGFLQALYPPVGSDLGSQTLRNGSSVQAPMNGYQLIPISLTETGSGSEDNGWLQDASQCANAEASSNRYFDSAEYKSKLASTGDFYSSVVPVVNTTFESNYVTFKNAYTVYDLINVAEIHNSTIPSSGILTNSTLFQLRTLADAHEWGLAYNASDNIRAIAGMQLAGEIIEALNSTLSSAGSADQLTIQFGAYATFMSFFGLSNLTQASGDFYGIVDYASSMAVELYTDSDTVDDSTYTNTDDLRVRFLFHNGTASNASEPTVFPLFGQSEESVSWPAFVGNLSTFAVRTTEDWCVKCGNTTGACAAYASGSSSSGSSSGSSGGGNGLSPAVNGVIGAMVTLAVILALEAAIMLIGGFRLVRKGSGTVTATAGNGAEKA